RFDCMKLNLNDYEPKEIIRIIREWTELTQKEFGKTINKKERTIQDYESGQIRYSAETLMQIAKIHNVTITIEKKGK
ncbi:MAG: helix-turn-helix domain-containing protein, partial [Eubacterium sp.]|nr:helix-turn-helix domain-containing protein [Eubacterium sp.]